MNTPRTERVTPNTSADHASNRPARLPRRQRVAAAIASTVISCALIAGVVFGMSGFGDAPVRTAGEPAGAGRA